MLLHLLKVDLGGGREWGDNMTHTREIQSVFILSFLSILTTSCAPLSSDYRKEGFNLMQQNFESFNARSDFHTVIELKKVRVHIVSDRKYFKWDKAAAFDSAVAGYATSGNEIFVFGKRIGNEVTINQAILGHELNHLLNFKNPKVANPDKLDQLELCYSKNPDTDKC